jgi:hypothetical protein
VAQALTPMPRNFVSEGSPRYLAEAPVAMIRVSALISVWPSITTWNGRDERSTRVAVPVRISAPKRSAWRRMSAIICWPLTPSG